MIIAFISGAFVAGVSFIVGLGVGMMKVREATRSDFDG